MKILRSVRGAPEDRVVFPVALPPIRQKRAGLRWSNFLRIVRIFSAPTGQVSNPGFSPALAWVYISSGFALKLKGRQKSGYGTRHPGAPSAWPNK